MFVSNVIFLFVCMFVFEKQKTNLAKDIGRLMPLNKTQPTMRPTNSKYASRSGLDGLVKKEGAKICVIKANIASSW